MEGEVVTRRCKPSVAVVVALAVNVLALVYAIVSLFGNYSVVRWLILESAVLFLVAADIYDSLCRRFSAVVMHIISTLVALKAAL